MFDDIDTKNKPKDIDIEYEYMAQDIIRYKDEDNVNSIVWYYDNNKREEPVGNITVSIKVDNSLINTAASGDDKGVMGYPEKYSRKAEGGSSIFEWAFEKLDTNNYQQVYLNMTVVDTASGKLNIRKLVILFLFSMIHIWILLLIQCFSCSFGL
jgi:hypothetical protein